ncbi:hypothetical protein J5X84_26535 [Streptosporangiaceae bacterium NEAU-GS5]|nr:hypothetical protein [Streptosporangiaceae bacterium NEAU-GS5]
MLDSDDPLGGDGLSASEELRETCAAWRELEDDLVDWSSRTGVVVEIWALPTTGAAADVVRAVRGAVAEALANVEKHSGAQLVSVALTMNARGMRLTVSDDGAGCPDGAVGRGIAAMKAHFAAVGGTLSVHGVPGGGTTVSGVVKGR